MSTGLEFNIKRGLSTSLISDNGEPLIELQDGCWYLCEDTVDLYVCIDGKLQLINVEGSWDESRIASIESNISNISQTLAAFGKTVKEVENIVNLPNSGDENLIYLIVNENRLFRWNKSKYIYNEITSDWQDIDLINGGVPDFIKVKTNKDYSANTN